MLLGMILKEAREVMLYKRQERVVCAMSLARPKEREWSSQVEGLALARSTVYLWEQEGRQRMWEQIPVGGQVGTG